MYISSHNVSLFELEIIKKDLIGMAKSAEISDIQKSFSGIMYMEYAFIFLLWLSLPFDGPFLIKGNGWAITVP